MSSCPSHSIQKSIVLEHLDKSLLCFHEQVASTIDLVEKICDLSEETSARLNSVSQEVNYSESLVANNRAEPENISYRLMELIFVLWRHRRDYEDLKRLLMSMDSEMSNLQNSDNGQL